jgi:hypothetical protein
MTRAAHGKGHRRIETTKVFVRVQQEKNANHKPCGRHACKWGRYGEESGKTDIFDTSMKNANEATQYEIVTLKGYTGLIEPKTIPARK